MDGPLTRPSHREVGFTDRGIVGPGYAKYGSTLTQRELAVIEAKLEGLTSKEVAFRLGISEQTVKNHITAALTRTGAPNMVALAAKYVRWQLRGGDLTIPTPAEKTAVEELDARLSALEERIRPILDHGPERHVDIVALSAPKG